MAPPEKCPEQVRNRPCNKEPVIAPLDLCEDCSVNSYWKRITKIYQRVKDKRRTAGFEYCNAGCNWERGKRKVGKCDWETEGGTGDAIEVPQRLSQKLRKKCTEPGQKGMFQNSHSSQVKFRFEQLNKAGDIFVHLIFKENVILKEFRVQH